MKGGILEWNKGTEEEEGYERGMRAPVGGDVSMGIEGIGQKGYQMGMGNQGG
jgi:hypothetical protein